MITEEIRTAIAQRAGIPDEWEHFIEQCWEEETEVLSRNIDDTICFLENYCIAESALNID